MEQVTDYPVRSNQVLVWEEEGVELWEGSVQTLISRPLKALVPKLYTLTVNAADFLCIVLSR